MRQGAPRVRHGPAQGPGDAPGDRGSFVAEETTVHGARCFFFQAEDGIRDVAVTGVQTCALPISNGAAAGRHPWARGEFLVRSTDAGFEKGRVAAGAVQGEASAGKVEAHRIGAADGGGDSAGEISID